MTRAADAPRDAASPLADPGMRLAARTIDVSLAVAPHVLFVGGGLLLGAPTAIHAGVGAYLLVTVFLFALNLLWLHRYGQSVGKRMLGLRIVRASGERVGLGRVFFLRMFFPGLVESIPLLGTLFFVVDALVIFGSDRQTIHDRFADTIVVDLRREAP